ncbi:MAG: hypothetical protein ACPG5P_00835 [Saprospiraceae bacterium]
MENNKMGMVFYRYNENEDLEIMLDENANGEFCLPESDFQNCEEFEIGTGIAAQDNEDVIELDESEVPSPQGIVNKAIALEGKMENKMRKFMKIRKEEGNYLAFKEATKKIMPHQYAILKELKDVLMERNLTKYI